MKKKAFDAAREVIDFFAEQVKYRFVEGKIYQRIACIDDDMFSAYVAADRYHYLRAKGQHPVVDCLGGFGPMSRFLNPKIEGEKMSEAQYLRYTLLRLGVARDDISLVVSEGTNTGKNLSFYYAELLYKRAENDNILFCPTKRLVGRLYLTQIKQQPHIKADYYFVDNQPELCLYNGKALAGGLPWLSEAASIYDRYIRYAIEAKPEAFMERLNGPIACSGAGEYLCSHYKLKSPKLSLKKIGQYALTLGAYCLNVFNIHNDYLANLYQWQNYLSRDYGLKLTLKYDACLQGTSESL